MQDLQVFKQDSCTENVPYILLQEACKKISVPFLASKPFLQLSHLQSCKNLATHFSLGVLLHVIWIAKIEPHYLRLYDVKLYDAVKLLTSTSKEAHQQERL